MQETDTIQEVDLTALLAQRATEKIHIEPAGEPGSQQQPEENEDPTQFSGDFADDLPPELSGEEETTLSGELAEKAAVSYDPEKLAQSIVNGTEAIMQAVGPFAFEMTLPKEDRNNLKILAAKYRESKHRKQLELTEEDQKTMVIFLDYSDYEESLPFTDKERASLVEPLTQVLRDAHIETSPTTALIIAACIVMFPRILPLIKNFFR